MEGDREDRREAEWRDRGGTEAERGGREGGREEEERREGE